MAGARGLWSGGVGPWRVGLALTLAGLAGCGSGGGETGYDPSMRYPVRTDPIVLAVPPTDPTALAPSGKLIEAVTGLDSIGGKTLDPRTLTDGRRAELAAALEALFGTPAAPRVEPTTGPDPGGIDLSPEHLAAGSRAYRRLCNQCHGLSGDGNGPAGAWVYPHPRDFRSGVFKVSARGGKPTSGELLRVIRHGVPASSMQPFDLIPEGDLRAAAAYTVHLAVRGEVEDRTIRKLLDVESGDEVGDLMAVCREESGAVRAEWVNAQADGKSAGEQTPPTTDVQDPDYQESIRRGHRLFVGEAGCTACHRDYGRADGFKYSIWGTPVRVPDLTRGEFRWGKDVPDLAARVRHGIPASGMPANPFLSDQQVGDLVNFVREVGYPQRLPADVRDTVYPAR